MKSDETPRVSESVQAESFDSPLPLWLRVVERRVSALRFGSVQIVIHEGRVTQVESTEKVRFQAGSHERGVNGTVPDDGE